MGRAWAQTVAGSTAARGPPRPSVGALRGNREFAGAAVPGWELDGLSPCLGGRVRGEPVRAPAGAARSVHRMWKMVLDPCSGSPRLHKPSPVFSQWPQAPAAAQRPVPRPAAWPCFAPHTSSPSLHTPHYPHLAPTPRSASPTLRPWPCHTLSCVGPVPLGLSPRPCARSARSCLGGHGLLRVGHEPLNHDTDVSDIVVRNQKAGTMKTDQISSR